MDDEVLYAPDMGLSVAKNKLLGWPYWIQALNAPWPEQPASQLNCCFSWTRKIICNTCSVIQWSDTSPRARRIREKWPLDGMLLIYY